MSNLQVKAEGTYQILGTPGSTNGSPDAVSWSTGNPLAIDSFGNYIAPTQNNGTTDYNISYSTDKGTTWTEVSGLNIAARVSLAYDNINDTLFALSTNGGTGDVTVKRLLIKRDQDYKITNLIVDPNFTNITLDSTGSCNSSTSANPVALIKYVNGVNYFFAFWSTRKDCGVGQEFTESRASILPIQNDASDSNPSAWTSITGAGSPASFGPANVDFTTLYSYSALTDIFQNSAVIPTSGSHQDNIYFFNIDENDTHGFIRFDFNVGTNHWLNPTSRVTFGGDVNDSQGYNLKRELMTKPVFAISQNRVYIGIARWLDNTNGDTQSLFYVDFNDNVALAANLYSAGGTHCLYPTLDISYDQVHDQIYSFYLTSGASNVCGHTDYKTFDGTTLSNGIPFFSVDSRSVDIPITYANRYDDKILLFFRVNNAVSAGTPPHDIYFGYVGLDIQNNINAVVASGVNYSNDFSYYDFNRTCSTKTGIDVTGDSVGALILSSTFRDEFETPNNPYSFVNDSLWEQPATWGAGSFDPKPNGEVNIYSSDGAYLLSRPTFTAPKLFSFRAKFSQYNFEHIGLANNAGFNKYAIFSTGSDGVLKARTSDGSESNTVIGTSYYDDYHDYTIAWDVGLVTFYIDGVNVASFNSDVPTGPMKIILSNNDHSSGANLYVDKVNTVDFPGLTGTYVSCAIDSGVVGAQWTSSTFSVNLLAGQNVTFQVRTSNDSFNWSSWSSNLNSGATIPSPLGRYAQYQTVLTTNNANISPSFYDVTLNFEAAVAPIANDDSFSLTKGTYTSYNIKANDVINNSLDGLTPLVTVAALHGTAVVTDTPGGIVTYTPAPSYSGPDVFTYQLCDIYSLCDTAIVNVTVNPIYVGPTTAPESATVVNNANVQISVLNNDSTDGTFDLSTLTVSILPAHGVTSVNTSTGVITFTPTSGYTGADSFTYNICDNHSLCQSGVVSLSVNAAPDNIVNSSTSDDLNLEDSILSCVDSKPLSPTILTVISSSLTTATVSFRSSVGGFDSYQIQISTIAGSFADADIISVDKISIEYIYKNLLPNTTYYFRIREKNGCNFSDWSNEFKATTSSTDAIVQSVSEQINTSYPQAADSTEANNTNILLIIFILTSLGTIIGVIVVRRRNKGNEEFF